MKKSALPQKRRFPNPIGLVALLMLTACNLNTITQQNTNQPISGEPQVRIASPLPNATFLEGVPVNIQAQVLNAGADINRVEVAVDDTIISTLSEPNTSGAPVFSVVETWTGAEVGTHNITVTAIRGDGTTSAPQSVTINIVNQDGQQTSSDDSSDNPAGEDNESSALGNDNSSTRPTNTPSQPTNTPPPSDTPQPDATDTPSKPMASFTTGVNVRRGPDRLFEPPIGSFAANDTAEILAVNTARTWYKVRYYNGEGWVFGNLMSVSGDTSNLPVDPGPPIPTLTPIPPTPIPATPVPQTNINLVAGNIRTDPDQPTCKQTFNIYFDVANLGSTASPSGSINVEDTSNGLVTRTQGGFPAIQPGQTVNIGPIPLTVDTNYEAEHVLALIIDPGGQIAETNEGDNRGEKRYTLRRGNC
jgi:cell division septation protein DedD